MQRALGNEGQSEGQQQAVQRIEPVETAQKQSFHDDTEQADRQWREH